MYLHMSLTKSYKTDLHFLSCIFKEVFLYAKATKVVDMNIQYMSSQKSRVNVHIYSRVGPYAKTTRVSMHVLTKIQNKCAFLIFYF